MNQITLPRNHSGMKRSRCQLAPARFYGTLPPNSLRLMELDNNLLFLQRIAIAPSFLAVVDMLRRV
jgi:hypothetical protein